MEDLDDSRWETLDGAYGIPYDPRPALARLATDRDIDGVWEELWDNLHHQGEVGEASYAAVPHLVRIAAARRLVDWNLFALVGTIELEKAERGNPELPAWLRPRYEEAWERLFELARDGVTDAADTLTLRCLLATLAIAKGDSRRGRFLLDFTDAELDELLDDEEQVEEDDLFA